MLAGRPVRLRLLALALLFGSAVVALALAPASQPRLPALSTYSAAPSGARALWLWLEAVGYEVSTLEDLPYRIPASTGTLLLLAPRSPPTDDRLGELERWVGDGGTLVVAAEGLAGSSLLGHFGFGLRSLPASVARAESAASALLDPAIRQVMVEATEELVPRRAEAEILLSGEGRPFAAAIASGKGRVIAISAPAALSNRALREEGNARFALSLVGPPGRGALVFDELHHGIGAARQQSLWSLLFEHAWGHAALYAGLLAFGYVALRGRRFGRAQPVLVSRGRSLSEYVSSLAGLYRAGGKRAFIAEHFRKRLRRDLAQSLGLPGDASDEQLVARSRALGRDPGGVLAALTRLGHGRALDESNLVGIVREAEEALAMAQRTGAATGAGR